MYDVLLITIDSLRPDYVGFQGQKAKSDSLTLGLDQWAKDAFVFTNAISQGPRTPESFPAMLSGLYSCRYLDIFSGISEKRKLISEMLKKERYHTCAFNSNPYISRTMHYNRGFDLYDDNLFIIKNKGILGSIMINLFKLRSLLKEPYVPALKLNKQVYKWLDKQKTPQFTWVHYMDVHGPYISKKGWYAKNRVQSGFLWRKATHYPERITEEERNRLISSYKEEVRYADYYIGRLLKRINQDKTVIILTADHGECLGEHNLYSHKPVLYDTLLRIPLVIKVPPGFGLKPHTIDRMVRALDIVPTIVDLLGIKYGGSFDGESLVPLMQGDEEGYKCRYAISEVWTKYLSVRSEKWKLIANFSKKKKELFDLERDPNETVNLVSEFPDVVREFEGLIKEHLLAIDAPEDDLRQCGVDFNEAVQAQLKGLGYM